MTKEEAKAYIDEKCVDSGGILVIDFERIMSRENAADMGAFDNDEMQEILKETADAVMRNTMLLCELDDALSGVIKQHLSRQVKGVSE